MFTAQPNATSLRPFATNTSLSPRLSFSKAPARQLIAGSAFFAAGGNTIRHLLISYILFSSSGVLALPNEDKIARAVEFLKDACVTRGSKTELEISGAGNIGVTLQLWRNRGAELTGSVSFSQEEIEGLAVSLSNATSNQASEMRECMRPYIDRIFDVILE